MGYFRRDCFLIDKKVYKILEEERGEEKVEVTKEWPSFFFSTRIFWAHLVPDSVSPPFFLSYKPFLPLYFSQCLKKNYFSLGNYERGSGTA